MIVNTTVLVKRSRVKKREATSGRSRDDKMGWRLVMTEVVVGVNAQPTETPSSIHCHGSLIGSWLLAKGVFVSLVIPGL